MSQSDRSWPVSRCCSGVLTDEPIFLVTETGRRQIGRVPLCSLWKCRMPAGEAVGKFTKSEWWALLEAHPTPPYYFMRGDGGGLEPESRQRAPGAAWSGQDLAVGIEKEE